MKKNLLLLASLVAGFVGQAQVDENGYTTVEMTMGNSYANRVFFDFSENNIVTQDANNWDLAFYRNNAMDFGTRINDAKNVLVYEASAVATDWDNIDVADEAEWGDPLYNPDLTSNINEGAFDVSTLLTGPLDFGWGTYNTDNHHIEGKVIFVLKYQGTTNTYKKFMIEDYYGGYTFKYSSWDGTAWSETQTQTVANGTSNRYFNYFSFDTNAVVADNEPEKAAWDLMFTRYWTFYNGQLMYRMSGVIQAPELTVAKVEETQAVATFEIPADDTSYLDGITTIGHSWKPTSGVYDNVVYYVKEGSNLYRMYFITNGGSSTGNMHFKYKDITSLSIDDVDGNLSFAVYPNPSADRNVTLLYDLKNTTSDSNNVSIYNLAGAKVFETEVTNNSGFYTKDVNLSGLQAGVYVVKMQAGNASVTQKLILQ